MRIQSKPDTVDAAVFECLADERRRLVLEVLLSDVYESSVSDLATLVVARGDDKPLIAVTEDEHDRVLVSLRHRHLPKLVDAGLVEHDDQTSTVRVTSDPSLRDPGIQRALCGHDDASDLGAMFEALSSRRRRLALSVLVESCRPLGARELAGRIAAREREQPPETVGEEAIEQVFTALWHVHLPELQRAGLLTRDDETGELTDDSHPGLRLQWLDVGL